MRLKKGILFRLVIFLAVVSIFNLPLLAQTFDAIKNQVKIHVLENGMKFIVLSRHEAPVVSFHLYADERCP